MRIDKLQLHQFRSYRDAFLQLPDGITVLSGANAQGKTNLLEGVFLCCAGKSHRAAVERDLVMWDCPQALVRASITRRDGQHAIDMALLDSGRKRIRFDGAPVGSMSAFVGQLSGVLFSPENVRLIKEGPRLRRQYMDVALSQVYRGYLAALQQYNRALLQRNNLLKSLASQPALAETLPVWDAQLAEAGAQVMAHRDAFCSAIAPVAARIHAAVSGGREHLQLTYEPSVAGAGGARAALLAALARAHVLDRRRCSTSVGPHRDDIRLVIDGVDARAFASQGQQRTAALALKMAELDWMQAETGERPVLLLDDVFSELDAARRAKLLDVVQGGQTIITCTEAEALPLPRARIAAHFVVADGTVTPA